MIRAWGVLGILLLVPALAWPFVAVADPEEASLFSPHNPSTLVSDAETAGWTVRRLTSTAASIPAPDPADASQVLLVISPERPYSEADARAVRDFIEAGGRLVVADAFGQANSIVADLGLGFDRGRLVQVPNMSVEIGLDSGPVRVELGTPTGLHIKSDVTPRVLARSSNDSFIDLDGDGVIGAADPGGPFPLVAEREVGGAGGKVLLVADPSLLLGNASAQILPLLLDQLAGQPGILFVDESHGAPLGMVAASAATAARALFLSPTREAFGILGGLLVLAALAAPASQRWGPHRFLPERFITRAELLSPRSKTYGSSAAPSVQWTASGYAAVAGGAGLLVLGILWHNPQAQFAGGMLLVAAAAATLAGGPALRARARIGAPRLVENRAATCEIELENPRARSVHVEVRQELPSEFEVGRGDDWFAATVTARSTLRTEFEFLPAVPGPFPFGPTHIRTEDPLHLRSITSVAGQATELQVRPSFETVRTLPFGTRVPMITMGPHLVNRAGEGMEFHSLREYQLGDSFRIVNWKASARSKDLVVNQRVHETMTSLTIVIDARAVAGAGPADATPLVRLARGVASLAAALLRVRDRIRVFVYTDQLYEAPTATGSRQFELLMDTLSGMRPSGDMRFEEVAQSLGPRIRPKTPVLIATCAESDPSLAAGIRLMTALGALPMVLTAPVHTQAEPSVTPQQAEQVQQSRDHVLEQVRGLGVPVHELRPGVALESQFRMGGA